jgi:hypothetical protein
MALDYNYPYSAPTGSEFSDAIAAALAITTDDYSGGLTGAVPVTPKSVLTETVSVKRFGAKGDGSTNDTVAIQAAIDALATQTYQSVLGFPPGNYLVDQLVPRSGVVLFYSMPPARLHSIMAPRLVANPAGSGSMFLTASTVTGFGIAGLYLIGRGAAVDQNAIELTNATSCLFSNIRFENFGGQCLIITGGVKTKVTNTYNPNCGAVVKAALRGAFDIGGTEHELIDLEIGGGVGAVGSGTVASASLFNVALVLRAGAGCQLRNVFTEFADIGIKLAGSSKNFFTTCIADNCPGHGMHEDGTSADNRWLGGRIHRCGHDADNTYYGFWSQGTGSRKVGMQVTGAGDTNRLKYAYYDDSGSGFDGNLNTYRDCHAQLTEFRTAIIATSSSDRRCGWEPPLLGNSQVTVVGAAQTVNLTPYKSVKLQAASAASVATLTMMRMNECLIEFADANTTLTNSANLICPGGTSIVGTTTGLYRATCKDGTKVVLVQLLA